MPVDWQVVKLTIPWISVSWCRPRQLTILIPVARPPGHQGQLSLSLRDHTEVINCHHIWRKIIWHHTWFDKGNDTLKILCYWNWWFNIHILIMLDFLLWWKVCNLNVSNYISLDISVIWIQNHTYCSLHIVYGFVSEIHSHVCLIIVMWSAILFPHKLGEGLCHGVL